MAYTHLPLSYNYAAAQQCAFRFSFFNIYFFLIGMVANNCMLTIIATAYSIL